MCVFIGAQFLRNSKWVSRTFYCFGIISEMEVKFKPNVSSVWWISILIRVFPSLTAGHCGVHSLLAVFWLHGIDGFILLAPDRNNRLLRSLHVHTQNLRRCQNRLSCSPTSFCYFIFSFYVSFFLFFLTFRFGEQALKLVLSVCLWPYHKAGCVQPRLLWTGGKNVQVVCAQKSQPITQWLLHWNRDLIIMDSWIVFFFFYYYLILTFLLHTSRGPKYVIWFTCLCFFFIGIRVRQ